MDMVYNIGEMAGMRDIGRMIRRADTENFNMLKVIYIVGNGFMISCMAKEFIFLMITPSTKVNGQIIIKMATGKKPRPTAPSIRVSSLMVKNMEKVTKYLQITLSI